MRHVTRALRAMLLAALLASLGGCAALYVDGNAPEVPSAQFRKPAQPVEVQLLWEFQTKGAANAQATQILKTRVHEQIAASGLFAKVTDTPTPGSGLLTLTVNNIPLSDDAASKGFIAGLTFGLAGQTVGDGYVCTMRYTPGRAGAGALEKSGKHVIYTSIGTGQPPVGALKMANIDEAVTTMLRQLISRTLDELSRDPSFP
jgi:hypothetical protein